jgi:MOSC domain
VAGRVVALGTCARAGDPILPRDVLRLEPGVGVAGDRYARGTGHWSGWIRPDRGGAAGGATAGRASGWPDAEVTLADAAVPRALGLPALALRRNVVTEGADLAALVGRRFRLGAALLDGVRPCDPCRYLADLLGRPALVEALAGRGGLRARVVAGGEVRTGDAVLPASPGE